MHGYWVVCGLDPPKIRTETISQRPCTELPFFTFNNSYIYFIYCEYVLLMIMRTPDISIF